MAARRRQPPLDPFERAARRSDPQYQQLAEAAKATPPSAWRAPRLLLLFGVLVAAAAVARGGGSAAPLRPDCDTARFALGGTTLDRGELVSWSATGPDSKRVVLSVDSPTQPTEAFLAGPSPLKQCLVRGSFTADFPRGSHTVTAFLLADDGTATVIRTVSITAR